MGDEPTTDEDLPWTPRLRDCLSRASGVADEFGHGFVGVEHLMLSIVRDRDAVPTQLLEQAGYLPDVVERLSRLLDSAEYRAAAGPSSRPG